MNSGIRHEVSLKLRQVDVEGAVKPERRRDGRHYLPDEAVEVGVAGAVDVQVAATDVVDSLVVHHEGAVGVLQRRVRRQDGIVRLYDCGRNLEIHIKGRVKAKYLKITFKHNGQSSKQDR